MDRHRHKLSRLAPPPPRPAPAHSVKVCSVKSKQEPKHKELPRIGGFGGQPSVAEPKKLTPKPDGPSIHQTWSNQYVQFDPINDNLYGQNIKFGLVIGTYAAVPYIHLQLEARKRFYPHVPLLIHDDNSPSSSRLYDLCNAYGCDFETNTSRHAHFMGDLTAFVGGLKWAEAKRCDILLKLSRRWVFLTDWSADLRNLALESQYHTFSNYDTSFRLSIRTECIALSVKRWADPLFYRPTLEVIASGNVIGIEDYIQKVSGQLESRNCLRAGEWAKHQPKTPKGGYAVWGLMSSSRRQSTGSYFWHDSHSPEQYAQLAISWGLPYNTHNFVNPNS
jgi:hypothetical protein